MSYYALFNYCAVPILDLKFCLKPRLWGRSQVPKFKNKKLGQHTGFQKVLKNTSFDPIKNFNFKNSKEDSNTVRH